MSMTAEQRSNCRPKGLDKERIRDLYLAGHGTVEIAKMLGTSAWSVNRALRVQGIKRRSRREALANERSRGRWQQAMMEKCDFNEFVLQGELAFLFATDRNGL